MNTINNNISKSLSTMTEMLDERGFNTEKLQVDNETVKLLMKKNKLEFLLDDTKGNKCFIKYILQKIKPSIVKQLIEEIIDTYNIQSDKFTIILIIKETPGQTVEKIINTLSVKHNYYIQLFILKKLLFNITKHIAVPKHTLLNKEQISDLIVNLKLKNKQQLPVILKSDPIAQYYGMRTGDICEITRLSITTGYYKSYRLCR